MGRFPNVFREPHSIYNLRRVALGAPRARSTGIGPQSSSMLNVTMIASAARGIGSDSRALGATCLPG